MQEDDPEPLPGCFGCLGDTGMLAIALLLLIGVAVHRADAAVPVHPDDAVPAPLQICAPVMPKNDMPEMGHGDDNGDIS